jgi:hypothetical protein
VLEIGRIGNPALVLGAVEHIDVISRVCSAIWGLYSPLLYQFQESRDLDGLGIAIEGLQIELLRDPRVNVDVVAPTYAP